MFDDPMMDDPILGDIRAGTLQVRLANSESDLAAAQRLRFQVFVEEMGAKPTAEGVKTGLDMDEFDAYCDHLLVVEHASGKPEVVGTYRLFRRQAMKKLGRFYTAGEFDISAVEAFDGEILELGRSCVDARYRNRAVMQLLWRGNGAYVAHYSIGIMFGCASLPGADPKQHATALAYLHHYHLAPPELRLKALPERYVDMNVMPKEAINQRREFAALPALVKGYLRLGGYVGDGAVVDQDYNTTDVGIVVKTDLVTEKYVQRYGRSEE